MLSEATTAAPAESGADTIAIGLFDDEGIAHDVDDGLLQALVDSGEAKAELRKLAVTHSGGKRYILAGLGPRSEFDAERARVAAATVVGRARELGTAKLCWELPHHVGDEIAGGFVEGTLLAAYAYRKYKTTSEPDRLLQLALSAHHDVSAAVVRAEAIATAANAARDLQNAPANDLTPSRLAERAAELAAELDGLSAESLGRDGIEAAGMGAFAAVARGSARGAAADHAALRPAGRRRPGARPGRQGGDVRLGRDLAQARGEDERDEVRHVGRRGGARGHRRDRPARAARPRHRGRSALPRTCPPGTPSGPATSCAPAPARRSRSSTRTPRAGSCWPTASPTRSSSGAERLVDMATLTGAIVTTFGSTHAGLFGSDDAWCEAVAAAGRATGELVWRLPLHAEYAKAIEGRYGDIVNAVENRKAGSIVAAEFLKRFTGDVPWAHLDIAGTAWDTGKAYAAKGGTGFGVRLLVELATMAPWTSTSPTTTS